MSDREKHRALGGGKNLASPFNEGFTFSQDEYAMLKRERPALFDELFHQGLNLLDAATQLHPDNIQPDPKLGGLERGQINGLVRFIRWPVKTK